jgi:GH25 family lysozyme M1 (1,4-beta-N-acetylmuramidase)
MKIILDQSYWQGPWDYKVAEQRGIAGAIMKASGGLAADRMFEGNLKRISLTNLEKGSYHYFLPAVDIADQVELFSRQIGNGRFAYNLGLWLDLEYNPPKYIGGKLYNMDGKENNPAIIPDYGLRVLEWLQAVEKENILRPGIYTNVSHALKFLRKWPELAQYDLWLSNPQDSTGTYTVPNCPAPWPALGWKVWQYSWKGLARYYGGLGKSTNEGWSENVDLNVRSARDDA